VERGGTCAGGHVCSMSSSSRQVFTVAPAKRAQQNRAHLGCHQQREQHTRDRHCAAVALTRECAASRVAVQSRRPAGCSKRKRCFGPESSRKVPRGPLSGPLLMLVTVSPRYVSAYLLLFRVVSTLNTHAAACRVGGAGRGAVCGRVRRCRR